MPAPKGNPFEAIGAIILAVIAVYILYALSVGTARFTLFVANLPLYPGDAYGQARGR